MPKKNHESATAAGYEGHVLDARDNVHELDPSRNVDGTVVDGYESDERDLSDRDPGESPGIGDEPRPTTPQEEVAMLISSDGDRKEPEPAKDADTDQRTDTEREADENAAKGRSTESATTSQNPGGDSSSRGTSSSASATKRGSTPAKK